MTTQRFTIVFMSVRDFITAKRKAVSAKQNAILLPVFSKKNEFFVGCHVQHTQLLSDDGLLLVGTVLEVLAEEQQVRVRWAIPDTSSETSIRDNDSCTNLHCSEASDRPHNVVSFDDIVASRSFMSVYEEKYCSDCESIIVISKARSDAVVLDFRRSGVCDLLLLEKDRFQTLRELIIAGNFLTSFSSLLDLLSALPGLQLLDASENRWKADFEAPEQTALSDPPPESTPAADDPAAAGPASPPPPDDGARPPGHALRTLVLNAVPGLSWPGLARLLDAAGLRHLRELGLARNRLPAVPAGVARRLLSAQTLRLERNALAGPADIAALQHLPALSALVLSHNPLAAFAYPPPPPPPGAPGAGPGGDGPGGAPPPPFRGLRSLYLSGTGLRRWEDVDALARLPALRDVRLQAEREREGERREGERVEEDERGRRRGRGRERKREREIAGEGEREIGREREEEGEREKER